MVIMNSTLNERNRISAIPSERAYDAMLDELSVAGLSTGEFHLRNRVGTYVLAVALTILALIVTAQVEMFRAKQSFLPVTAAITIIAWYGGLAPSLIAIAIAAVGWAWKISPPVDSLKVASFSDLFRLCLFVLVALPISSLHARAGSER